MPGPRGLGPAADRSDWSPPVEDGSGEIVRRRAARAVAAAAHDRDDARELLAMLGLDDLPRVSEEPEGLEHTGAQTAPAGAPAVSDQSGASPGEPGAQPSTSSVPNAGSAPGTGGADDTNGDGREHSAPHEVEIADGTADPAP